MKRSVKWIMVVAICAAVAAVFIYLWRNSQPKEVRYHNIAVSRSDIRRSTIVTGDIEPRNEVNIKPQINGTIAELYVQAGDKVHAGDPIAKLQVITEAANLSNAESQVRMAEMNMQTYRDIYRRDSALYEQKVVSREELDKSRLQYTQAVENLRSANDNLSIIRDGAARTSSSEITNTIVRSTVNGTVLNVPVKVGNTVMQISNFNEGTTIAAVADMRDLIFVGKIDETEVGKLREGMPMILVIGALDDRTFDAQLEYIAPKGESQNGAMMFEIKGAVSIPDSVIIRSGYSANAEIILQQRTNVLTLPEETITPEGDHATVQVLTDTLTRTYEPRTVTIGLSDGMNVEILSGIDEGEQVRGNEIIDKPGMPNMPNK